jgi:two-component system heavy metal sensor histidine kinase CusS
MPLRLLRRIPWTTLRLRLAVWNTAIVLLAILSSLLGVRLGLRWALFSEADTVLRGETREVAIALRDQYPDVDAVVAELRRKAISHEERGWFTLLLTGDGRTIWRSASCPPEVFGLPITYPDRYEVVTQVDRFRYARRRITDPNQEPFHVRIGLDTSYLEETINTVTRLLLPLAASLALVTPVVGYWLAVRATRPVAEILRTADRLRPSRLGDRLAVRGTQDELDDLSRTINRLLDQVADHVERQQQFVADAAHELRGPLAAMRSLVEVTISQDRSADAYRETLAEVLEEARHLSKLTNDLLLLAETGDESRQRPRQPVDLTMLARQTVAMFSGAAEERSIDLAFDAAGGAVMAPGDPGQLRQVLGNLLDNALRFTPPGGHVNVAVEADPKRDDVVVTVRDTGRGIDAGHLERVFDRFYTVDAARSRAEPARGGGLGLAICRTIVERHGGRITVESGLGRGATFTVRLPRQPRAETQPPLPE